MGRVTHQKPGKQVNPSNGLRGAKVSKQRQRHKVILEDVDQQKRKSLCFHSDPPPGYTFIPAGNPELTAALKEFAKKSNQEILAVTTTPHAARHELSREVHRVGWHFPTQVVARVCAYYGIRLTASGRLVEDKDDDKLFMKVYQRGQLVLDEKVRDQVTINTEAKQIIKDLFPNIPDNDLFQIIKTAFQLGDGRVGTAEEIPLVRRAQLSVVAHIRHTYTDYDRLLKEVPYTEARHQVETETLKKLILWRGDGEDKTAVEDTLREVVVISDEDDSDDEVEEGQVIGNDDVRVQIVSNNTRPQVRVGNRPASPIEVYSDEEAPKGFRYLPQVVRRLPIRSKPAAEVARQQSRYAVWDRHQQEYRSTVPTQPTRVIERIPIDDAVSMHANRTYPPQRPVYESVPQSIVESPVRIVRQQSPPTLVRGTNGRLYERIVIPSQSASVSATGRRLQTPPRPSGNSQFVRSGPSSPRYYEPRPPHRRTVSHENNDGSVVPSIESPHGVSSASASRRNFFDGQQNVSQKRHSGGYLAYSRPVDSHDVATVSDQMSKRRRVEVTPPSPFLPGAARMVEDADPRKSHVQRTMQPFDQPQQRLVRDVVDLTMSSPSHVQRPQAQYVQVHQIDGSQEVEYRSHHYADPPEPSYVQVRRVPDQIEPIRQAYIKDEYVESRSFDSRPEQEQRLSYVISEPRSGTVHYTRVADRPVYVVDQFRRATAPDEYRMLPPQNDRPSVQEYVPSASARRVSDQYGFQQVTETASNMSYQLPASSQPDAQYRYNPAVRRTYVQH